MLYSVWNEKARAYDYYESMGATPIAVPSPSHLKPGKQLGIPPESAGWPKPGGARLVGRGPYAKGVIAMGDVEAAAAAKPGVSKMFLVVLMAPIVYWALKR
jgi:hypothetical protein